MALSVVVDEEHWLVLAIVHIFVYAAPSSCSLVAQDATYYFVLKTLFRF